MKLRCTIGSQGFVGGATYSRGDEYTLEDEEKAKQLITWGYAEEVKEVTSSASLPPLADQDKVSLGESLPIEEKNIKKTKAKRKY